MSDNEKMESALLLLNEHHTFPGAFDFRTVIRPGHQGAVISAIATALDGERCILDVRTKDSSGGKYRSVKVSATVPRAEEVIRVWSILRVLDGVLTVL